MGSIGPYAQGMSSARRTCASSTECAAQSSRSMACPGKVTHQFQSQKLHELLGNEVFVRSSVPWNARFENETVTSPRRAGDIHVEHTAVHSKNE